MSTTVERPAVARSAWGRLIDNQTAIDFVGRRKYGFIVSGVLIVATFISLWAQGLNLGIDFEGGVSWDVPAAGFTIADAEEILAENGLGGENARIQERESESGAFIKVQVGSQPQEVGGELRTAFAEAAGVDADQVNVNLVSSSWGSEITDKALRALIIFVIIVSLFISIRFEWRMALAAIAAMAHDVLISVGIYSIFQFVVTPPTVIAFLTILGYSLYDTIVVFDRIKENEARFAAARPPYDDIINVSMNQVLMRSLMTSFSSIVPVISLLLIGAGLMGQTTLAEFALALLIGMVTGVYSSIFVAAPLLGILKSRDKAWESRNIPRAVGEPLRDMVMGAGVGSRRTRSDAVKETTGRRPKRSAAVGFDVDAEEDDDDVVRVPAGPATASEATNALRHPPRPRKKKRR
jgi:preprotein translocase subunit SecF